jgi:hypothetical protein
MAERWSSRTAPVGEPTSTKPLSVRVLPDKFLSRSIIEAHGGADMGLTQ